MRDVEDRSGRLVWIVAMGIAMAAGGRFSAGGESPAFDGRRLESLRGARDGVRFGIAVAVSEQADGWWIAVGDDGVEDGVPVSGSVEVFRRDADRPATSQRLDRLEGIAPRPFDRFGAAIALDGDTLVIGAPGDDSFGTSAGRVEIHLLSDVDVVAEAVLFDPDPSPADGFGGSVAIAGDVAVVGAMRADVAGLDSGRVVVFERLGGAWIATASLAPPDAAAGDWFGHAVATDGERIAVGAHGDDDLGEKSGAVWILSREQGTWAFEAKLVAPDGGAQRWFGFSVAIDGDRVLAGSPRDAPQGPSSGSVWAFDRSDGVWSPRGRIVAMGGRAYDWFGYAVALSGDQAIVGAPGRDATLADGSLVEASGDVVRCERRGARWRSVERVGAATSLPDRLAGSCVAIGRGLACFGQLLAEDVPPSPGEAWAFRFP